jgi:N6-L-threonylcarbamoyladenine synthase
MVRSNAEAGDADFFDLSFSGLKTAVLNAVRASEQAGTLEQDRAPIARAFQDALIDTLVTKVERALRTQGRSRVVLGGGVACNGQLQREMTRRLGARGAIIHAPSPRLATDNAAMIGAAGLYRLQADRPAPLTLTAQASLPIPGMFAEVSAT